MPRALRKFDESAQCDICFTYMHRCSLKRHKRQHMSEAERKKIKMYCSWPRCTNTTGFLDKANFLTHQRKHTGDKLVCPVSECEFRSHDAAKIYRHRQLAHPETMHAERQGSVAMSYSGQSAATAYSRQGSVTAPPSRASSVAAHSNMSSFTAYSSQSSATAYSSHSGFPAYFSQGSSTLPPKLAPVAYDGPGPRYREGRKTRPWEL